MKEIIQLTISLQNTNPLVWRTVLVNKETSFLELHYIIQKAMGWKNYHSFEFNLDGYRVGIREENDEGCETNWLIDALHTKLPDILSMEKDSFLYCYDLGDGWLHKVVLERVIGKEENIIYPTCIAGQMNCPPEDCGGIAGFHNLLSVLQDKMHPEYKETKIWVGKRYDPESFDTVKVNKQLTQLKNYMLRWNLPCLI